MTVNVFPAMVTVPVRCEDTVLTATAMATDPEPVPLAPEVTVIHVALLVAVHAQPLVVVTEVVAGPPPAATEADVGDSV
jgi:hypothetical protein